MSTNENGPQVLESPRDREDLAGGEADATVPQEQFQGDALRLITRGRIEYLVNCPRCTELHRHLALGNVKGPCGAQYELQPRPRGLHGQ